jgi:signal transduction histidine kinase
MYVMLFSLAVLVMLWLMQTVFLNVFYEGMKTQNIKDAAGHIATLYGRIQGQALKSELDLIANDSDVFVSITSSDGAAIYTQNPVGRDYQTPVERTGQQPPGMPGGQERFNLFRQFAEQVLADADGEVMQPVGYDRGMQMMLYGKIISSADGSRAVLVVSSPLQPLNDTVQILSRQLLYITLVIFVMALGISMLIAVWISRPLTRITGKAKLLARGRYDMRFDRGGYTEANELADTLNYATGALQQVENTRRELIANVSHDLRTPLTMIKLYAEMIRDLSGENKKKREQNVAVIVEECNRLTSLVQNLLDLSQLQSGAMPYNPAVFDLTALAARVLARYDALAQKDGYRFKFKPHGEALVKADEPRIEQVLHNLINNAVNYAGEDREITVAMADAGGTVRVSVSDNGEGIAPEDLDMIWDRYYKVDREHRRAVSGSGLGLSIVKSILDMHNMRYGVNSVQGQGATFWFELEKG